MKKRIISLLLALIMALSLLPVSALAVESSAEPTISADLPAEVALQPGDNFTLTVTALGSGTLSYQWYANTVSDYAGGTKIKGAESATYDVATAVEQVLYYYVEVTNTEEGKGPATVRSAISKVTVSKEGGGEVSDTPQITLDVVDAEDVVLPWHATTPRAFDIAIRDLGMTKVSYQWYKNSQKSYEGAEAIPDSGGHFLLLLRSDQHPGGRVHQDRPLRHRQPDHQGPGGDAFRSGGGTGACGQSLHPRGRQCTPTG